MGKKRRHLCVVVGLSLSLISLSVVALAANIEAGVCICLHTHIVGMVFSGANIALQEHSDAGTTGCEPGQVDFDGAGETDGAHDWVLDNGGREIHEKSAQSAASEHTSEFRYEVTLLVKFLSIHVFPVHLLHIPHHASGAMKCHVHDT